MKRQIEVVFDGIERHCRELEVKEKMEFIRNRLNSEDFNILWDFFLANHDIINEGNSNVASAEFCEKHPHDFASEYDFVNDVPQLLDDFEDKELLSIAGINSETAEKILQNLSK